MFDQQPTGQQQCPVIEPTVENIEMLIYELYYCGERNVFANKQLTLFQNSKESWDFCWLLLLPNKPVEVQHFGASCVHHKIAKCWQELDNNEEIKIALRTKLLDTLCKYMMDGNLRIVQTKLCVALSSYVIRTINNCWPTAVCDLIENLHPGKLSHIPVSKVINTLVEILTVIPEEFNSTNMSYTEKPIIRQLFIQSIDHVFSVIKTVMEQVSLGADVKHMAIKCFSNWSQNFGSLILSDLHDTILNLILNEISNEELSVCCVEAITNIYSHPEMHRYPNTVLKLIDKIIRFEDLLNSSIKDQNMFLSGTLYNLYISIGETHSRLLLNTIIDREQCRENILKLLRIILQCSATAGYYPIDETCSEQAFNFWYTFQDDIIGSEQEKIPAFLALFNPLYHSLIDTLLVKVQYPPDSVYSNDWTSEDKESFRCYRQDIGDCLMYCYNMLRVSMLSSLMSHFTLSLNHMNQSLTTGSDKPWQYLEAVMFAFSSIAENVDITESVYITKLFESLNLIPFNQLKSPRLIATIMEMFGSYCEWIYNHPEFLPGVLSLLLMGLKSDHIAIVTSTMALKDITRECQPLMVPYAHQLLTACEESLRQESPLASKERSRLMCTIGQVLTVMPHDYVMNYLNVILPPILHSLQESLDPKISTCSNLPSVRNMVVAQINMLTMLFATLDPDFKQVEPEQNEQIKVRFKEEKREIHPGFPVFKEILPLLNGVVTKWSADEAVIDAVSDCFKRSLANLLDHVKPLVMDIISMINSVYSISFQPSLLDILKQIMILFGTDSDLQPYLIPFYGQICNLTVAHCADVRQNSSLIEYFYSVAGLIMKKVSIVHKSMDIDSLSMFQCAMAALIAAEKPTVRAVTSFITEFINKSRDQEQLQRIILSEGESLVGQVLNVIGGDCSPRINVDLMSDILVALNQKYPEYITRWLSVYVNKQDFPTAKASIGAKEQFVKSVLREKRSKRKIKEIVNEFSLICRGLIGTEYAQQQIKLPY
ncbi:importin-13 [Tetranychus urticae]|uniref:Importin-13 n=1 Tax=Tetranychus urticae TaxID=32264 RepID=T1L1H4_TETUR|nr:importin-13 [Tetranychus urticae]